MRKLAIGLVVVSLAVFGSIEATANGGSGSGSEPVGVRFHAGQGEGYLEIYNGIGRELSAHNVMGQPVANGLISDVYAGGMVSNVWVAPSGAALHVRIGSKIFECNASDPDWQWD